MRPGSVLHVTGRRAYLDRGRLDGLAQGVALSLSRAGRRAASCTIERVADHAATCVGGAPRAGDRFEVAAPRPRPTAEPAPAPAQPPAELIEEIHARLSEAPFPRVAFRARGGADAARGEEAAQVALGHASWASSVDGGAAFSQERVDASLRGVPIGLAGLRAYADLTALRWSERPDAPRFRPEDDAQLYVWEAELSSREPGRRLALSVGRIWPWHAPGLAVLDGAQLGWRGRDGALEAGLFGGAAPDPVDLAPGLDRWTVGGYYAARRAGSRRELVRFVRHEARLGVRSAPGVGQRAELESSGVVWLGGRFDAGVEGRLAQGLGGGGPALEALRTHLGLRPASGVRAQVGLRFQGEAPADVALAGDATSLAGAYRADLDASYAMAPWLTLGVQGGAARDRATERGRAYGGPELALPRLFGPRGGVAVGYQEEAGWLAGRSAFVQAIALAGDRVRLLGRASYVEERFDEAEAPSRELGAYVNVEAQVASWLGVRASALGRQPITELGAPRSASPGGAGLVLGLDLGGRF